MLAGLSAAAVVPACKGTGGDSGLAGETGATPAPERDAEPAAWSPEGDEVEAFAWGVQSGDATSEGVLLSVRTTESEVELVVVQADGEGWTEVVRETVTAVDGTAQLEVTGLVADTAYRWVAYGTEGRSRVGRFRTALDASGHRVLTFAAVSCIGGNEPWPSMTEAAALEPDAFLLLGDQIYSSSHTAEGYRAEYATCLGTQGMADATASCSVIATWDDHEVANNWELDDLADGQYDAALATFREAFPQREGPSGGVWRKLSYGDVAEVYVLDCRSERKAADGVYLGREQMDWLKESLAASTATFKLIMNSVPITDYTDLIGSVEAADRWQGFPEAREEIVGFIDDEGITGVLWIAGDVHFAQVAKVGVPGSGLGEEQWEVCAGPGGSFRTPVSLYEDTTGQYPLLLSEWNTTIFRLDPGLGEITVTHLADDGSSWAEHVLALG